MLEVSKITLDNITEAAKAGEAITVIINGEYYDLETEAAAAHEKKIKSYLKRYGLSKVYSWTYWRDA